MIDEVVKIRHLEYVFGLFKDKYRIFWYILLCEYVERERERERENVWRGVFAILTVRSALKFSRNAKSPNNKIIADELF